MIENIPLENGKKFTIYTISEMLATTIKREVLLTKLLDEPVFKRRTSYDKPSVSENWEYGEYHLDAKRKIYSFMVRPTQDIIIPGWGHLASDVGAYGSFTGNACLNFAGSVEKVRELIKKNINPNFHRFDIILAAPVPWMEAEYLEVFPESPTQHAKILEKRAKVKEVS